MRILGLCTAWCSEIGSLMSLNAPGLHAFSDAKEPISLHQAVDAYWYMYREIRFLTTLTGSFLSRTGPPILAGSLLSRTGSSMFGKLLEWGLFKYVIVHTQPSHSVDLAGWQAKMASIEFWIPWRNAHMTHCICSWFTKLTWRVCKYTVRSGAEERRFWRARLDVLIFRLHSYHVLISYSAECIGPKFHKTLMFLGQAGTFLSFQARRSSAKRSSTSDLTVLKTYSCSSM